MRYILILILPILIYGLNLNTNPIYRSIKLKYGLKNNNNYMVESNLHIVGFSKNNLVEYIIQEPNEARDEEVARVFVQNIVNDKIVYSSNEILFNGSFSAMLKEHRTFISKIADNFNILEGKFTLKRFPLYYKKYKFKPRKRATYIYSREFNEKFLSSIKIFMDKYKNSKRVNTKVIYKKRHKADEWVYDYKILGYIKSPFTDRVAVIAAWIVRGWEGPPNVINLKIIGSSLSKGF